MFSHEILSVVKLSFFSSSERFKLFYTVLYSIGTYHYYSIAFFYILYPAPQWAPGRGQRGAQEHLQYKIIT